MRGQEWLCEGGSGCGTWSSVCANVFACYVCVLVSVWCFKCEWVCVVMKRVRVCQDACALGVVWAMRENFRQRAAWRITERSDSASQNDPRGKPTNATSSLLKFPQLLLGAGVHGLEGAVFVADDDPGQAVGSWADAEGHPADTLPT